MRFGMASPQAHLHLGIHMRQPAGSTGMGWRQLLGPHLPTRLSGPIQVSDTSFQKFDQNYFAGAACNGTVTYCSPCSCLWKMSWQVHRCKEDPVVQARFCPGYRGPVRWHITYNLAMLRLISFGMDLHWARCSAAAAAGEKGESATAPAEASLKVNRTCGAIACLLVLSRWQLSTVFL